MSTCISLTEDQIPLSLALTPNPQIPECKPAVTDITLYGEPSNNVPISQSRPASNTTKGVLSFKDWKEQQDLLMRVPKVTDTKQVRFNDLPTVNLRQPSSMPVATNHPQNLHSHPPICKSLELSVCEPNVPQQVRPAPLMRGLFNTTDAGHLLFRQQQQQQQQNEMQCNHCCTNEQQPRQRIVNPTPAENILQLTTDSDLKQQISTMQRQLNLLQSQVAELLRSQTPKPQVIDSATQCTPPAVIPKTRTVDVGVNTSQIPPETDQTFFNHVLGQVNQILQQSTDEDHVKFIESDASAESIPTPNKNPICSRPATDKSTFVNSLAEKYLGEHSEDRSDVPRNHSKETDQTLDIDVSTTCYNFIQKYDLLKVADGKKVSQKATKLL